MRLGPGDSNHDIIQEIDFGEQATFILTNWDDEDHVEVVIIELEEAAQSMRNKQVQWDEIKHQSVSIAPGESQSFTIDQHDLWHLAIVHLNESAEGVTEIHISVDYSGEDLVTKSLIMSMPSLWMTGWVLHRLYRLKGDGRLWFDSTPSHVWNMDDESE